MSDTDPPDDWADQIEQGRQAEVEYFGDSQRSPLPPEMRGESFPGLSYYDRSDFQ